MASDSRALEELRIDKQAKQQGGASWILWGVLALAIAGAAAYWFLLRAPAAIEVTLATVEELRSEPAGGTVLNASGYVTARRRATVSSKVTGRVVEVLVEEGKSVRKGQVLARLDAASAERYLALSNAELEASRRGAAEYAVRLDQARLTRHRTEQLRADGIVNQADVDAARTEVGALEARLALANEQVRVAERQVAVRQNDLSEMVILAPFDGVAISKDAQPGEMISPVSAGGGFTRTGICTLVDMSSLEIEVDVNESYIHRVTPGQRVEAVLDAYPDWRVPAAVITTVPAADRQKATVLVRIAFDALDPRILPDMGVKVAFLEAARPAAAGAGAQKPKLTIPKEALRTDGDSRIVFVAGSEGRAERRAVRAGRTNGERVEIDSGLAPGEKVVVSASRQLSAGARITEAK
jgi:RND family efflux transporter MFP subunit